MDPAPLLTAFRAESAAFAAAATGGRDEPVPSCPGWTVAHLVQHLGQVHRFWTRTLARDDLEPAEDEEPPPLSACDVAWYEAGAAALGAALEAADPARPMWNWSGVDQTAGWLQRRMAQETAIHRWDAEAATGGTGVGRAIDAVVAGDGVDELFEVFVPGAINWYGPDDGRLDLGGSLLVQPAGGGGRSWRVALQPGAHDVRPAVEGDSADAIVSGDASDVLLLLWNRVPIGPAHAVSGDAGVLDRWRALPMFD